MREKIANVLWGLLLVAAGLLMVGKVFDLISFSVFFPGWWTLILILPCFLGIIKHGFGIFRISGLLLGVALLLQQNNVIELDLIERAFLPAIFIIVGLGILAKALFSGSNRRYTGGKGYSATFAGNKAVIQSGEPFEGCNADAVFGGLTLDLTLADLPEEAVINASAVFGGIDIFVPVNAKVKVSKTAIFGGVTQKKKNQAEDEKVLYINALCMFGGVTIR